MPFSTESPEGGTPWMKKMARQSGRTLPTAWASIPTCSFPSAGRQYVKRKRSVVGVRYVMSVWNTLWRTVSASASGAARPSVSDERFVGSAIANGTLH